MKSIAAIADRFRPSGDPVLDEVRWRWSVSILFVTSALIGLGSIAMAIGPPGLGGVLYLAALLHLALLPPDGPIVVEEQE